MKYFITGTDTGVGKTVLSLLFMSYFIRNGENPFYLKPFQTGCVDASEPYSDARFICDNIEKAENKDPYKSVLYCFREPKAPYFAARSEKKNIDIEKTVSWINEKQSTYTPLIVEGAGGLFVPVTENTLIIDFIKKIDARPVLAAKAGLGTINSTLLAIEALKTRGYDNPAVVFIDQEETDPLMIKENIEAILMISGISVSGVIGKIDLFSEPARSSSDVIKAVVEKYDHVDSTSDAASFGSKGPNIP